MLFIDEKRDAPLNFNPVFLDQCRPASCQSHWLWRILALWYNARMSIKAAYNMVTCYWIFVRGIHRSPMNSRPVNSPHKVQWRGAFMLSLICAWTNGWVSSWDACDIRRNRAHYDVTIMKCVIWCAGEMRLYKYIILPRILDNNKTIGDRTCLHFY